MSKPAKTFEEKLAAFKSATSRSKALALECSQMALQHFADHGNVHYLQMFHDAMPQNYLRRGAFLKWAVDHAPLAWRESKFTKDKDSKKEVDLAGAFKTPFWDYNPETPITDYTSDNVISDFEKVIKKYSGDKRKPMDNAALATFEALRIAVEKTVETRAGLNAAAELSVETNEDEEAQSEAA